MTIFKRHPSFCQRKHWYNMFGLFNLFVVNDLLKEMRFNLKLERQHWQKHIDASLVKYTKLEQAFQRDNKLLFRSLTKIDNWISVLRNADTMYLLIVFTLLVLSPKTMHAKVADSDLNEISERQYAVRINKCCEHNEIMVDFVCRLAVNYNQSKYFVHR